MNRRVFVAGATLSLVGSALAGTPFRMERGERTGWERIGAAVPDGPGGALGRRQLHGGLVAIQRVAGVRPRWFRPPRRELTVAAVLAAAELDRDILLWSVTRGPAGVGTPTGVAAHIGGRGGPGGCPGPPRRHRTGIFDADGALARGLRARRAVEVAALPAGRWVGGAPAPAVTRQQSAGKGVSDDGHHLGACDRTAACSSAAHLGGAKVWG